LSERGAQRAEISLFFGASNEDGGCFSRLFRPFEVHTSRDSREILFALKPRWAEFEGDPLRLKPERAEIEGDRRRVKGHDDPNSSVECSETRSGGRSSSDGSPYGRKSREILLD
jgi:hypothetical protein